MVTHSSYIQNIHHWVLSRLLNYFKDMVEVSLQLSQAFVSQYSDMFVLKLGIVVMSLDQ